MINRLRARAISHTNAVPDGTAYDGSGSLGLPSLNFPRTTLNTFRVARDIGFYDPHSILIQSAHRFCN